MEEKKLTNEEILKSLDYCANGGNCQKGECVFANHKEYGKKHWCLGYACESALDLIHRLQAENERLTEENEYLDGCAKQFLADYQKCEIERAELENQVDELVKEKSMISQRIVKDTAKEIIAFVEEKDKKAGKYSIYRTLLQELKERYEVE